MSEKSTSPEAKTPEVETTVDKAGAQRRAYGAATATLREKHREEFNTLMKAECAALGVEWSPRPTEAEKAKQALDALLAAHPELREQV